MSNIIKLADSMLMPCKKKRKKIMCLISIFFWQNGKYLVEYTRIFLKIQASHVYGLKYNGGTYICLEVEVAV